MRKFGLCLSILWSGIARNGDFEDNLAKLGNRNLRFGDCSEICVIAVGDNHRLHQMVGTLDRLESVFTQFPTHKYTLLS